MLAVLSTKRRCGRGLPGFCALFTTLYSLISPPARADTCSSTTGLTPCFDANSLWLPAGRTTFVSLPSTRVNAVGQLNLGFAAELLHDPRQVEHHAVGDDAPWLIAAMLSSGYDMNASRWSDIADTLSGEARERSWALLATGTPQPARARP